MHLLGGWLHFLSHWVWWDWGERPEPQGWGGLGGCITWNTPSEGRDVTRRSFSTSRQKAEQSLKTRRSLHVCACIPVCAWPGLSADMIMWWGLLSFCSRSHTHTRMHARTYARSQLTEQGNASTQRLFGPLWGGQGWGLRALRLSGCSYFPRGQTQVWLVLKAKSLFLKTRPKKQKQNNSCLDRRPQKHSK